MDSDQDMAAKRRRAMFTRIEDISVGASCVSQENENDRNNLNQIGNNWNQTGSNWNPPENNWNITEYDSERNESKIHDKSDHQNFEYDNSKESSNNSFGWNNKIDGTTRKSFKDITQNFKEMVKANLENRKCNFSSKNDVENTNTVNVEDKLIKLEDPKSNNYEGQRLNSKWNNWDEDKTSSRQVFKGSSNEDDQRNTYEDGKRNNFEDFKGNSFEAESHENFEENKWNSSAMSIESNLNISVSEMGDLDRSMTDLNNSISYRRDHMSGNMEESSELMGRTDYSTKHPARYSIPNRRNGGRKLSLSPNYFSRNSHNAPRRNNFRNRITPRDDEVCPVYKNHQLLGDSQLVRFSEQLLRYKCTYTEDTNTRRINYCVSGQKSMELRDRLLKNDCKLHNKVIMLIGTNDVLYDVPIQTTFDAYNAILEYLQPITERIVLITIPPVPKLQNKSNHWRKYESINKFIHSKVDDKKIFCVDLGSVLEKNNNRTCEQFYEKVYGNTDRVDLIHLNRNGFKLLKFLLDTQYFGQD